MRAIVVLAVTLLASLTFGHQGMLNSISAQDQPIRVPVRSADPWMIKMLLEGAPVTQPEYSTLRVFGGGFGSGNAGAGTQGGFGGGQTGGGGNLGSGQGLVPAGWRIVVNPTDNSIWLFPKR